MDENDNVNALLAAGAAASSPHTIQTPQGIGAPYAVVPEGWKVEDLSVFLPLPLGIKQHVKFDEADSFVRYVNKFKDGRTTIFARLSEDGAVFRAVLDYHNPEGENEQVQWCRHVAEYNCPLTVEWRRWRQNNNQMMDQTAFAEFVEQNQLDVRKPSGATLLEIAMTLKAKVSVDFVSGTRLSNGTNQLVYQEEHSSGAGVNGNIQMPAELELGLPVFQGGPAYSVRAFLRYRIQNKKLFFQYVLFNPHKVVEHAAKSVLSAVEEGTKIKPFMGHA